MNDESDVNLQSELIRLRDSNAELHRKVLALDPSGFGDAA